MSNSVPDEIFWKIFFYIPSRPHIKELKCLINRINNYESYNTGGSRIYKVMLSRSKTEEEVSFETHLYTCYDTTSEYFDIFVSQAILLCLDKYVPTSSGYYFDRMFRIICSQL